MRRAHQSNTSYLRGEAAQSVNVIPPTHLGRSAARGRKAVVEAHNTTQWAVRAQTRQSRRKISRAFIYYNGVRFFDANYQKCIFAVEASRKS